MNKLDYYRPVLLGVVIGMSFLTLFYLVTGMVDAEKQPTTLKSNFAVVDTYKGCDVVQWTDHDMATYKYFLHCNNTRPVYQQ